MDSELTERQEGTSVRVLFIGSDPSEIEIYSDLIREAVNCSLDTMSHLAPGEDFPIRTPYDLVIMDLGESSMENGIALLEKLRRVNSTTGLIILSTHGSVEHAVALVKQGVDDYFSKPFNPDLFKLSIKRSLSRKVFLKETEKNRDISLFMNLLNSCQMISAAMEEDRILSVVRSYLASELGTKSGCLSAIYRWENGQYVRVPGHDAAQGSEEVLDIAIQSADPRAHLIGASPSDRDKLYLFVERGQLTPGLFVFRFFTSKVREYFCVCLSPKKLDQLEIFETCLRMLHAQIEVTGGYIQQYQDVQQLVFLDDATGLYNSRYLNTVLDREILSARTTGRSFAVLFLDADHFKQINDTHGHLVGTKLLNALGNHLKKYVRETDTVFRYGGDEFIAVLSPCDLQTAKNVAERIRHSVEMKEFLAAEGLHIRFTVSIGVALFPEHADSKKAIIEASDQAMYGAKKRSRNSVYIYQQPSGSEK